MASATRPAAPRRTWPACLLQRRERAQGMVEFALALPIYLVLVGVGLQLALLITAQIGLIWTTTVVARYVATGSPGRWTMADTCHTTFRNNTLTAFPMLRTANLIAPSGWINSAYTPGSSNCATTAGNTPATTRLRGGSIRVTLQYNPSNLMFIPTNFFGVSVLSSLPAYTASAVLE